MQIFLRFYAKRVVFLSKIADGDRDDGDEHLGWRRVPAEGLDAQFESEIVDGEVQRYDGDVSDELPPTIQLRGSKSDVFLKPKAREQRDRENDTKGCDVRSKAELVIGDW